VGDAFTHAGGLAVRIGGAAPPRTFAVNRSVVVGSVVVRLASAVASSVAVVGRLLGRGFRPYLSGDFTIVDLVVRLELAPA
jgi:hypothetical protein